MPSLLEELKQTKPFATVAEEASIAVLVSAERLKSASAGFFKGRDLTHPQYNVLRILRGAGDKGLTCGEISERMITRDSDITRMLDRLESRQLIKRERGDDDRRIVRVFISEKGLQLLNDLDGPISEWHSAILRGLSSGDMQALINLLEKLRNSLIAAAEENDNG